MSDGAGGSSSAAPLPVAFRQLLVGEPNARALVATLRETLFPDRVDTNDLPLAGVFIAEVADGN